MKQEEGGKSARKQSKGDRERERERERGGRGWIKVGGAGPSHFLRLKITTILLLLC